MTIKKRSRKLGFAAEVGGYKMARAVRKSGIKSVPLSEIKNDLSRFLREAEKQDIVINRHGKPAGILIGFDYHGSKEIPTGTCNAILKAAGLKGKKRRYRD